MKKLLLLIFLAAFASCSDDTGGSESEKDRYLNIGAVTNDTWTYVSLATGKVVGTSPANSAEHDAEWAQRTDWDLALCGTYMRTNGGTSGTGNGGAIKVQGTSYESISSPTLQDFAVDSVYTVTLVK